MSLIPVFEIGLCNAWIFMLLIFLPVPLVILFHPGVFKKTDSIYTSVLTQKSKRIFIFSKVIMFSLFIYSIFLPLQLGTTWFSIGLPICLLGLILQTIIWMNVAINPVDQPVTKGFYRYSRHPMYVTLILVVIGTGISSASWLFLLLAVVFIITHFYNGVYEEHVCLKAYGNAYREYMDGTPRWIGIPKSKKSN